MYKYSVLMTNFNGYELFRDITIADPECEYVYVTDYGDYTSNIWNIVHDERLAGKNPIEQTFYVRYHPFEYVHTDTCIVLDGSMLIHDSLHDIIDEFKKSGAEIGLSVSKQYGIPYLDIMGWYLAGRLTITEYVAGLMYILEHKCDAVEYGCEVGYKIVTNTKQVNDLHNIVWTELYKVLTDRIYRVDQMVFNCVLNASKRSLNIFYFSRQLVQSDYIQYCAHGTNTPIIKYIDKSELKLLRNKFHVCLFEKTPKVSQARGDIIEGMLLTKHNDENDFREWLDWHLNKCGFDRIHIFDNESRIDIPAIINGDSRISYEYIPGHARQYVLYDNYVNFHSTADWIMPIDDDEYVSISTKFNGIHDVLDDLKFRFPNTNMFAIRWKHLFPYSFHVPRNGEKILKYCTVSNSAIADSFTLGDTGIKTLLKRNGMVHYQETWENPARGHVPLHTKQYGALSCNNEVIVSNHASSCIYDDEPIRLLHCRYKGPDEWEYKCKYIGYVCNDKPRLRNREFKFNELLPALR